MADALRPRRGWYAVAGLLVLAGPIVAAALGVRLYTLFDSKQFLGPGRQAIELARGGKYVLWSDYSTLFEGQRYDGLEALPPGSRLQVIHVATGAALAVGAAAGAGSNIYGTKRKSIASFVAPEPGRYEIIIEGDFPRQVFSASADVLAGTLWAIFGGAAAILAGLAAGATLGIWIYVRRNRAAPAAAPPAPAAGAAPAESPEHASIQLVTMVYALQAASFLVGVTLLAAVIVNYLKREEVAGTWLESHFRWQIRTFWWWLAWTVVGIVLAVAVVGLFILIADAVWLIYRIVKGWLQLSARRPMYA